MDTILDIIGMIGIPSTASYTPYKIRKTASDDWSPFSVGDTLTGDFEVSVELYHSQYYIFGVTENPAINSLGGIAAFVHPNFSAFYQSQGSSVGISYSNGDIFYIRRIGSILSHRVGSGSWVDSPYRNTNTLYPSLVIYSNDLSVRNIKKEESAVNWGTLPAGLLKEDI